MSEFNEKRKNNSSGQFRRHHHSEGTDIKNPEVNWPCTFWAPTHDRLWLHSIHHSNQLHFQGKAFFTKDIPSPISLVSSYLTSSKRKLSKPSDKAGAKYVFERIYSAAVMEGRHSGGKKSKFNSELSRSPLIRRNGGLERILQKFPLNPHNIFLNLPVNVRAHLQQTQAYSQGQIRLHALRYSRLNSSAVLGPGQWSSAAFTSQK